MYPPAHTQTIQKKKGLKLIAEFLGFEISEVASLGVVGSMLGVGKFTYIYICMYICKLS
jgi:hypothetical protein